MEDVAGAYHHVGTVEDQGQEERETTEVHVALGIELAGLDLHALVSENGSTRRGQYMSISEGFHCAIYPTPD